MICVNCVNFVESVLIGLKGVVCVFVVFVIEIGEVEYDLRFINWEDIIEVIEDVGFDVMLMESG